MMINGTGHGRTALILYGTETGTSQDVAEEVGRLTQRLHFETDVAGFDEVAISELSEYTITILVIATTGQGDFPSNALSFWKSLLRKKLPLDFYKGVRYALAGLGDSSYPKYNWAARKLEKRLQQLGAESLLSSCEADEQDDEGTDGVIVQWLESLPAALLSRYPLADGMAPILPEESLPSKWRLSTASEFKYNDNESIAFPSSTPDLDHRPVAGALTVTLRKNERVTPSDHWQDVRHLVLTAAERDEYFPGDALAITPKNFSTDVELLIFLMNWGDIADTLVSMTSNTKIGQLPKTSRPPISGLEKHPNITLRTLLSEYLDITAIPRRSFFTIIARYSDNEMQRTRLLEFTNPEFLDEYFDYTTRPRRSILEVLQEFDSVRIPWQEAVNVFPLMRPRQFSIASGGDVAGSYTKTPFELLVAVVKYRTVIKKIRQGVCTRYLAALPVGSTLKVVLRTEGRFHVDYESATRHNLLIGAGTGIAPLRALIHEEASALAYCRETGSRKNTLIFGARSEKADFFFKDEWAKFAAEEGSDFNLLTAFSRDQKQKVYVQDRIREQGKMISGLLRKGDAFVFICGSSGAMPKAIREALLDALVQHATADGLWTRSNAESFLAGLEKGGRYIQETW